MRHGLLALGIILQLGCAARFNTVGSQFADGGPQKPTPEEPKPETWPGGYLQIKCQFESGEQVLPLGRAGMLNSEGTQFRPAYYQIQKFADEGWISAELSFPNFDSTQVPLPKPDQVRVEYYIFLRPDWHAPENFYEIRRVVDGKFEAEQTLEVSWRFTKFKLICKVEKP